MRTAEEVEERVEAELAGIGDEAIRARIASLRVPPRCEWRAWDYGTEGTTHPCFVVLEHPPSGTGIAYCEQGFGPRCPWGLLFLDGPHSGMGMDCCWYATLEDAFRESQACDVPPPPGYEVR